MTNDFWINLIQLGVSSGFFGYALLILKNWLKARIKNKNEQMGIEAVYNFSRGLVAQYANSSSVPKFERKQAVLHDLEVFLDKKGYKQLSNNVPYLMGQIERAYQDYKGNGGDIHKANQTASPSPSDNPTATTTKTYTQAEVDELLKSKGDK